MQDGGASMRSPKLLEQERNIPPPELVDPYEEWIASAHQEIAGLAYSYWEARAGRGGSPWEDWFRAEEELKRRKEL
jgi:Protein of unknown function (DUF2934)